VNLAGGGRDYVLFSSGGATGIGQGNFTIGDATANAPRLSINPAGNVGIGTISPAGPLHVHVGPNQNLNVQSYNGVTALNAFNDAVNSNVPLLMVGSSFTFQGGNVGIGVTSPKYKLSVSGTIGTTEVIVTNTGLSSDYVFKPDYRLRPLNEVAAYIKEHHHLPEIPSEKEVTENGVSLGEMQAKLLAKVEELTLHMIHADETNKELALRVTQADESNRELKLHVNQADERNNRLEQQNQELEERIARLEAR